MDSLQLTNIGPVRNGHIEFGDLTVLVGPQASGKSITLQLFKLLLDTGSVQKDLRDYGLDWQRDRSEFFDIYFGEGMRSLWTEGESRVVWNGKVVDMDHLVGRMPRSKDESVFLIPAQRVLVLLRNGWPRTFGDYDPGDPYVVRAFSERLRMLVERYGIDSGDEQNGTIFPRDNRLKRRFREALQATMFADFQLGIDRARSQKRLVLKSKGRAPLPFMVWSAGQREFVPLLLGMYRLMPPSKVPRPDALEWAIIEEPEMGLHPRAISTVLLLILELLRRDYRVCLSTHSPQVLEMVWAMRMLSRHGAHADDLLEVFGVEHADEQLRLVADTALSKQTRVYYFDDQGQTHDISTLDSWEDDEAMASWGGMLEFGGRVNDTVARVVADDAARVGARKRRRG